MGRNRHFCCLSLLFFFELLSQSHFEFAFFSIVKSNTERIT